MALMSEVALTHDVFDSTSYSGDEMGDVHLRYLKDFLLKEAIVRNLRDGDWSCVFNDAERPWHKRGTELLKKLILQNRLLDFPPALIEAPVTDFDWFKEAFSSHGLSPLDGILHTAKMAEEVADIEGSGSLASPIEKLTSTPLWGGRSPSTKVGRTKEEYEKNLNLLFRCANSIMFIDPHLDPSRPQYRDFAGILKNLADRDPKPMIEVHRVCYHGSGPAREIIQGSEWKERFQTSLSAVLLDVGLSVTVYIWDDFHDRYLISDLMGIGLQNGFDTTTRPDDCTTWSRLGRQTWDAVGLEFDYNSIRHKRICHFKIP